MKLIIAGSRTLIVGANGVAKAVEYYKLKPTEIVCGMARGVDCDGQTWAMYNQIHIQYFKADWDKHGRSAGPIRNRQMAEYADALLLIWNGHSRGSANMKLEMQKLNKPIFEILVK